MFCGVENTFSYCLLTVFCRRCCLVLGKWLIFPMYVGDCFWRDSAQVTICGLPFLLPSNEKVPQYVLFSNLLCGLSANLTSQYPLLRLFHTNTRYLLTKLLYACFQISRAIANIYVTISNRSHSHDAGTRGNFVRGRAGTSSCRHTTWRLVRCKPSTLCRLYSWLS